MAHRLSSDELGNVGENLFRTLSGQARLVCNKSDRDITGWDFIVEFPMAAPDKAAPLDQRAAAACHVQLKSTAGESGARVSARLSAMERLAKDPRPALIVVFRLRRDGNPLAGYLIHLIDAELGRILRRLRQAQADGAFDVNRTTISFDYVKSGLRFELTADGLRAALENAIGDDPAAYVLEKQRQLAELGYEEGEYAAEALVWIDGPDHFNDMMLGLAPIKPKELRVFDRRFGINIPYHGDAFDAMEELRVELPQFGECDVVVRSDGLAPAAVFRARMLVPPPIADGTWLLIDHPDFTIRFREESLHFQTQGRFDEGQRTLENWITLLRALIYMANGDCRLSLERFDDKGTALPLAINEKVDGPYQEHLPDILRILDGWRQVLDLAGLKATEAFTLHDIWDARPAAMAVELLTSPAPTDSFEFDEIEGIGDTPTVEALFFNSCDFAGASISYAALVTLERGDGRAYRSTRFAPLDVRGAVSDLTDYGAELARRRDIKVLIDPAHLTMHDPSHEPVAIQQ